MHVLLPSENFQVSPSLESVYGERAFILESERAWFETTCDSCGQAA